MRKTNEKNNKGITLIALIITIIVMLILVAVTITVAVNGGLFNYAQKAVGETKNAINEEQGLGSGKVNIGGEWYDSIDEYINPGEINWQDVVAKVNEEPDKYLQQAAALGQDITQNTFIGLGTNGKVVNLDLWYYQKQSGSYNLVNPNSAQAVYSAYKGRFVEGKIQGKVPAWIFTTVATPDGKYGVRGFAPVTRMDYTFFGCRELTVMPEIPSTVTELSQTFRATGLKDVTIPSGVTVLGGTFMECTSLETVTIPNGVTRLGSAFIDCTNLKNVNIPNGVTDLRATFEDCRSLETVTIPNGVTVLLGTFEGCTNLKNVNIPSSVISLGSLEGYQDDPPFEGCTSLKNITIPDSVTIIGEMAFKDCTGLTNLVIPNSVISIGRNAFENVPHVSYSGTATGKPWGADSIN